MTRSIRVESGMGLIAVLLGTGFFSAVALGLALLVSAERRADANYIDALVMLDAAESGLELAARDLAVEADWNLVLRGTRQGRFVDGSPTPVRTLPSGGTLDILAQTNLLNCGRPTTCSSAQMNAVSFDRPWGLNNPRWQPYIHGPLSSLGDFMRDVPLYLVAWVADDGRESDGDPLSDDPSLANPGRAVVFVRAEVFGTFGARRAVEGLVARVCWTENTIERCLPGVRVQSWREVRQWLP